MEKEPVMRAWLATMAARVAVTSIGLREREKIMLMREKPHPLGTDPAL